MKNLYLIPTPISENISDIPSRTLEIINTCEVFICERVRTSRRFIKSINNSFDIDASLFIEIAKKGSVYSNAEVVAAIAKGENICFMSEAGSPCIADPGSEVVSLAREKGYTIVPLSGPSSLLMALMASGLNGQHFTFNGYLPVKRDQLTKKLKEIERLVEKTGYTQLFIETPFRNVQMFEAICTTLNSNIYLSIAFHISSSDEYVNTKTIANWKKDKTIEKILSQKAPCIFLLGR